MKKNRTTLVLLFSFASMLLSASPKNVLLITVDDMNDWVGAFGGHPQAITPNLDQFSKKSVVFHNAYCSAPLCNPSRTSMLTGYQPAKTGVYGNHEIFRKHKGFETTLTLPQYFEKHGYKTVAAGKLFHNQRGADKEPKKGSDPGSFQQEKVGKIGCPEPKNSQKMQHGLNLHQKGIYEYLSRVFDWVGTEDPIEQTGDWQSAEYCAKFLNKKHSKPFFLACGIFRPHLPWYAPKDFFDLYDGLDIQIPEVIKNDLDDVPYPGANWSTKVFHHEIVRKNKWKDAVKGYLANLSYADACVGHLLNALNRSEYAKNTIVVIMGDHGWHLGEKQHWCKNVLWERAAKTPLMIYNPSLNKKGNCYRIVSLLDVYPTLLSMIGLPEKNDLDGNDISPLLTDVKHSWNYSAMTTKGKGNHSLRSEKYRYTRYENGKEELYDHSVDKNEWKNLAEEKSMQDIIQGFRRELQFRLKGTTEA